MIYHLKRNLYADFKVFEQNKLPPRCYFIPFPTVTQAFSAGLKEKRYKSDKVKVLNGEWDFKYYAKHRDVPSAFDTDKIEFDKLTVPSVWQLNGYEPPVYTNIKYPFPVNPPQIPTVIPAGEYGDDINGTVYACGKKQYNSVGVYRTFYKLQTPGKHCIISFLGVAGALELYINGKYVGYSEGSHNTAEFDIDPYVFAGNNEIVVLCHKWCNGSYLEDQDMFRHNGIFRDVLIYENEPTYIWDFEFFTAKRGAYYDAFVNVKIAEPAGATITVSISDKGKVIATRSVEAIGATEFAFDKLAVSEWNAEEPKLYELTLTLRQNGVITECIKKNVGFKHVDIANRAFLFNDKKIKIKGVNHHDTNPFTGYVMSPDEIEKDILLFKDFNINAVRTSHYPPDPLFLELCDYYGVYVIDEADIETHGTRRSREISNNRKWKAHYWDRVFRMYYRDRNSCSVIMWSLGNESGGKKCQIYCYKKLKELTSIPIHYERMCAEKEFGFDVVSQMYVQPDDLLKILEGRAKLRRSHKKAMAEKPYFLCEYAHAMGVGPGSLEDYWNIIYSHDNAMGGCIWEFADHAIFNSGKKYAMTYGGDHGEYTHDSNFCTDGLFYPDRKPHTGAYAVKNVYRPVRATLLNKNGLVGLKNCLNFRNAEYLTIKGTVSDEGGVSETFKFNIRIAPGDTECVNLHIEEKFRDSYITLTYYDGDKLVAYEQLALSDTPEIKETVFPETAPTVEKLNGVISVKFSGGHFKINEETGAVFAFRAGDVDYFIDKPLKNIIEGSVYTNIYRAPTDNDMYSKKRWIAAGYDKLKSFVENIRIERDGISVSLDVQKKLCNDKGDALFKANDLYRIYSNGIIDIRYYLKPLKSGLPYLPRIGKVIELKDSFDDIIYFGRGDLECYPDFKEQSIMGVYRRKASDFLEPYIKPQESGNRTDVRYAAIRDKMGRGIMITHLGEPFNFGVKKITDAALAGCTHREDVAAANANYISVDAFMMGVGSNSCGPLPLKKYMLYANKEYAGTFRIVPFTDVKDADIIY